MTSIGYLVKKRSSEIKESPWGIQFMYPDAADDRVCTLLMDRMGESGVKWTRIFTSWQRAEITKGQYQWDWLDKIVYGLTERGVNIYLETGFSSSTLYHDFPAGRIYPPTRTPQMLDGYCAYVNEMARIAITMSSAIMTSITSLMAVPSGIPDRMSKSMD